MDTIKVVPFEFENEKYEVRAVRKGFDISVSAYKNGEPANGYVYHVSVSTAFDFNKKFPVNAVDHLIETAKSDIEVKMWEKYLAALESK